MNPDLPRLQRLLGRDDLRALRGRLRARYARGAAGDMFTLTALSAPERTALESLLGLPSRQADSMRLSRAQLDAVFARAGLATDLRSALEALEGPIVETARLGRERASAWKAVVDGIGHAGLLASLQPPLARGRLRRLAGDDPATAHDLLARAAEVIARLPATGVPLAGLAADVLGDAHALDRGRPVARLVLNALAPAVTPGGDEESDRARWARLGVLIGELNRPALALNLAAHADSPAGALAEAARGYGEPLHLSLRALLPRVPRWAVAGREVFVCENPGVVAVAASRLGRRCAPLVCTDGNPAAAQLALLGQLRDAGARLRYHGDFDWDGLRIANRVMREFGARPWRFGVADYRPGAQLPLHGRAVRADWDPALGQAMRRAGQGLHEEAVIEDLLADLDGAGNTFSQGPA